jgi:hypothetical protein
MNRFALYGLIILLVVGPMGGYQLYQMRQHTLESAEGFRHQAEQIEKLHRQP